MKITYSALFLLVLLCSVCFAATEKKTQAKARGLMVNAYDLVHEADEKYFRESDSKAAEGMYYDALKRYLAIEKLDPNWLVAVIQYRIAYCNDKVMKLRKERNFISKQEPKEEIANELQGKMTFEQIEEMLNIRNTELAEVKNELSETTKKLEKEIAASAETKEKLLKLEEERDKKVMENSTEGYVSVKEINEIIKPIKEQIEKLKELYKNAKTDEEKAKVIEQYVIFLQTLSNQLKFEDLRLAEANLETILIDVRDSSNPIIYKNGKAGNDPLIPKVKMGK